jgi:hypothetical protein
MGVQCRYSDFMSQVNIEALVQRTIAIYNRQKMPQATAKLVNISPVTLTISFTGSFCYDCGVMDYLEDFISDFKILTDKVGLKIGKTRQTSPRSFEVDYLIRVK